MVAEDCLERQVLHLVVFGRARAVGVDVVDRVGRRVGVGQRVADGADDGGSVGLGAGAVDSRRPFRRSREAGLRWSRRAPWRCRSFPGRARQRLRP